jgi:hypothetical protein|tara:strand:+ start:824 stop:997 length:174 start_codon:yes stop_codon:yes gene_type:complete
MKKKKLKVNDTVEFKAASLSTGVIRWLPDEDSKLYSVELPSGNTIRCTEHYFKTGSK